MSLVFSLFAATSSPADVIYFLGAEPATQRLNNVSYIIPIDETKSNELAHARAMIAGKPVRGKIVIGRFVVGSDGINRDYFAPGAPEWSWHMGEFLGFSEAVTADGPGTPIIVERDPERWITKALNRGVFGFPRYRIVSELGPGPPLWLRTHLQPGAAILSWASVDTNRFYTLETKENFAGAAWIPLPGHAWPMQTNRWAIDLDSIQRFYRVKAEWTNASPTPAVSP